MMVWWFSVPSVCGIGSSFRVLVIKQTLNKYCFLELKTGSGCGITEGIISTGRLGIFGKHSIFLSQELMMGWARNELPDLSSIFSYGANDRICFLKFSKVGVAISQAIFPLSHWKKVGLQFILCTLNYCSWNCQYQSQPGWPNG